MGWRALFGRPVRPEPDSSAKIQEVLRNEPRELLRAHRERLSALRLETGYPAAQFEALIQAPVLQVAQYVHVLPGTRAENHSEPGGLLRLALETACYAFRRADGQFFGPMLTDVNARERERVWAYAAFIGGLLRPLGRCITHVRVNALPRVSTWNPYLEPQWDWMRRVSADDLQIIWPRADPRPVPAATVWLAARILSSEALSYLESAEGVTDRLLEVLTGDTSARLSQLIESAHDAAIDEDLAHLSSRRENIPVHMQVEHRLLDVMRVLAREQWTINTPGGRIWHTQQGVFLAWRPAVNDLLLRLRADGVVQVPRDPDTIAELLIAHGVLTPNQNTASARKHYFKIQPALRGAPKQTLDAVRLTDPERLGLNLDNAAAIDLEAADKEREPTSLSLEKKPKKPTSMTLELPLHTTPTPVAPISELPVPVRSEPASLLPSVSEIAMSSTTVAPASAPTVPPVPSVDLKPLDRFGEAGKTLRALAERLAIEPQFTALTAVEGGVALAFPEAITPFCQPQTFLSACEAQGLLVPVPGGGRRILYARTSGQAHLPEQYLVLSPRIAKYLPNYAALLQRRDTAPQFAAGS